MKNFVRFAVVVSTVLILSFNANADEAKKKPKEIANFNDQITQTIAKDEGNVVSAEKEEYVIQMAKLEATVEELKKYVSSLERKIDQLSRTQAEIITSLQKGERFVPSSDNSPVSGIGNDGVGQMFQNAFSTLQKGDDLMAETLFSKIITDYRDHPLAGESYYWLGEIKYRQKDYKKASVSFSESYQNFPNGMKAPESFLKMSMSLAILGNKRQACNGFKKIVEDMPSAPANIKSAADTERIKNGC